MNRAAVYVLSGVGASGALYLAIDWLFVRNLKGKVADGGKFKVHATGYWPKTARPDERQMEGKDEDRTGRPLHTVEEFFAGKSDHVSVSGDDAIFPYGQKLIVDWFGKELVGRVVDTGSHFRGSKKVYRVMGEEPLDFCVYSKDTKVPKKDVVARIVQGDHWITKTKKTVAEVDKEKFKGQTVAGIVPSAEDVRRRGRRHGLHSLGGCR